MKSFKLLGITALLFLVACEGGSSGGALAPTTTTTGTSTTTTTTGGGSSSSSSAGVGPGDNALMLRVFTTPELGSNMGVKTLRAECAIPSTVDPFDPDLSLRSIGCDVKVEEQVLYYSTLTFELGTGVEELCTFISFAPYYYRASNSATFAPSWNNYEEVDCSSLDEDSAVCYSGPGTKLIDGFPSSTNGATALPDANGMYQFEVNSAFANGIFSNRWTANIPRNDPDRDDDGDTDDDDGYFGVPQTARNTMVPANSDGLTLAFPGGGGPGSPSDAYQDYRVVCENDFAEALYAVTLFISDYDYVTSSSSSLDDADNFQLNDFGDWDSILNTIDPQ